MEMTMRRKRLQHCADTLCHMFCGWRLVNSYQAIESLGSGMLAIDVLTTEAKFGETVTDPLPIAGELQHWLMTELKAHSIPIDRILSAMMFAKLDLTKTSWKNRMSRDHCFDHKGAEIVSREINRCVIACSSRIVTDETEYVSKFHNIEEWPEGFPGKHQLPMPSP